MLVARLLSNSSVGQFLLDAVFFTECPFPSPDGKDLDVCVEERRGRSHFLILWRCGQKPWLGGPDVY